MGADNCAGAHTVVPAGPQMGVPFTTGTTGTQGQNEANCYAFGSTNVTNDVWFDWQATATGNASMTTCAGTTIDTKIAAYPLNAGACPADGTSLACNDDACGLQSTHHLVGRLRHELHTAARHLPRRGRRQRHLRPDAASSRRRAASTTTARPRTPSA